MGLRSIAATVLAAGVAGGSFNAGHVQTAAVSPIEMFAASWSRHGGGFYGGVSIALPPTGRRHRLTIGLLRTPAVESVRVCLDGRVIGTFSVG